MAGIIPPARPRARSETVTRGMLETIAPSAESKRYRRVDVGSAREKSLRDPPMKTTFARCVSIALLLHIAPAAASAEKVKAVAATTARTQAAPATKPAGPGKGAELAALEQKLLGTWRGGDCVGDYTFNADGTYELNHFTPGNNTLTGTWSLRWDALPPTLVVLCKTSDFKKTAPNWPEYEYLGKPLESKVIELTKDTLVCRFENEKEALRYERPNEK